MVQGPFCIMATPYSPSFLLRVTACPSFYISSNTSSFQRHSSGKSSTLISNFARSRVPGNKGRGLSISSLLTIAVLKFQLWNLFCATAWNKNVGAVPKFAQWLNPTKQYKSSIHIYDIRHSVTRTSKNTRGNMNQLKVK